MNIQSVTPDPVISDEQVIQRVTKGDSDLFEIIMRRYNQRLFRVIRGILTDEHESEEVMQEAYVRAYANLHQFEGRSKFSTWLTKIAVYEAFARLKSRRRVSGLDIHREESMATTDRSPEERTYNSEMRSLLERTIDSLPEEYRSVLIMRDIEGMSTSETADCLELSKENVKVRLFRARAAIRRQLFEYVGSASSKAFQFLGTRCDRVVHVVLERIQVH